MLVPHLVPWDEVEAGIEQGAGTFNPAHCVTGVDQSMDIKFLYCGLDKRSFCSDLTAVRLFLTRCSGMKLQGKHEQVLSGYQLTPRIIKTDPRGGQQIPTNFRQISIAVHSALIAMCIYPYRCLEMRWR